MSDPKNSEASPAPSNKDAGGGRRPSACCRLRNGWFSGTPNEPGHYLRGFDDDELDEDADLFEYRDGKWFREGNEWFCSGGVWKPCKRAFRIWSSTGEDMGAFDNYEAAKEHSDYLNQSAKKHGSPKCYDVISDNRELNEPQANNS